MSSSDFDNFALIENYLLVLKITHSIYHIHMFERHERTHVPGCQCYQRNIQENFRPTFITKQSARFYGLSLCSSCSSFLTVSEGKKETFNHNKRVGGKKETFNHKKCISEANV